MLVVCVYVWFMNLCTRVSMCMSMGMSMEVIGQCQIPIGISIALHLKF